MTNNILSQYKNKMISKELAISIVIKFLKQEGLLYKFLEEIKKFKPYKKGNDDPKFLISYAIGLQFNGTLDDIFLLPYHNYPLESEDFIENGCERTKWDGVKTKWCDAVGQLVIKPLFIDSYVFEWWK